MSRKNLENKTLLQTFRGYLNDNFTELYSSVGTIIDGNGKYDSVIVSQNSVNQKKDV